MTCNMRVLRQEPKILGSYKKSKAKPDMCHPILSFLLITEMKDSIFITKEVPPSDRLLSSL